MYEYAKSGSLDGMLNDNERAGKFSWIERLNVVKGVANGLSYLHHKCSPPIIHRGISSKNILLDDEYVARISNFGTAKLLKSDSSNYTSFAATCGYAAPGMQFPVIPSFYTRFVERIILAILFP